MNSLRVSAVTLTNSHELFRKEYEPQTLLRLLQLHIGVAMLSIIQNEQECLRRLFSNYLDNLSLNGIAYLFKFNI
jgi:hypothetical protein